MLEPPVIKLFTLNRNPDAQACITPIAGALTLTVSRPVARWDTMPPEVFDGAIECATYAEVSDLLRAHDCANLAELLARDLGERCIARENVIIDGAPPRSDGSIKLTSMFARLDRLNFDQFMEHYPNRHAPIVRTTPELPRYVQNYALDSGPRELVTSFDAVAELWWPDRETAIRSWSSDSVQIDQAEDCTRFIGRGVTLFGDERYIVG
jgi:uncharacterized protein (TIGR02118 family)